MDQNKKPAVSREQAQQTYNTSRLNLLILLLFTAVNIVLLITESDSMFLFSATVPYFSLLVGMLAGTTTSLVVGGCIAAITILLYLLCWILSKKSHGWLIFALVLFSIDTLLLAYIYISAREISGIVDILFHIWVLYYLIIGIINGNRLKRLPKAESPSESDSTDIPLPENSIPLRICEDTKHRVLLEYNWMGNRILYRRVKKTNELVINNHVYSEIEMLIEQPHDLIARFNGHTVIAGMTDNSRSYISIDGTVVAKKLRWF